jgi:hypothetical protein
MSTGKIFEDLSRHSGVLPLMWFQMNRETKNTCWNKMGLAFEGSGEKPKNSVSFFALCVNSILWLIGAK